MFLGTIQILRNQEVWVGGVREMILFDYGGGWVWQHDYVIMGEAKLPVFSAKSNLELRYALGFEL